MALTTQKIAITLPRGLLEAIRRAVQSGRTPSVSAYIADAVSRRQQEESLADLVAELTSRHGEPSAEDYAWADRVLGAR